MKKYKIVSPNKFAIFIMSLIIIGFLIFFAIYGSVTAEGKIDVKYQNVLVEQGDTLWSIAENSRTDNPHTDVRDIITHISEVNNISPSDLKAGDIIKVPIGL